MHKSRHSYLFGRKRSAKLNRLRSKGWLQQPDQHVLEWLIYLSLKPLPKPAQTQAMVAHQK